MKFKLQCEQRFPLFPTSHLFPVGALTGNIANPLKFNSAKAASQEDIWDIWDIWDIRDI